MEQVEKTVDRINLLAQERGHLYLEAGRRSLEDEELQRLLDLDRELVELWQIRRVELVGRRDLLTTMIEESYRRQRYR